jgi:SLOG in TRPM, prokaryote
MTSPFPLHFAAGGAASAIEVAEADQLPSAVEALGLVPPRPTLVVVGGAGGLDDETLARLRSVFASGIVPVLQRCGVAAVDGGTLSGVMRLIGEARATLEASFPLIGVTAVGTVAIPGRPAPPDTDAVLEPHHTRFVLVPGDQWGAESPWIAQTATALAGDAASITVLVNGGEIAYSDVEHSLQAGRRVVVIAGSGRTADALAAALAGVETHERAQALVASGLISSVPVDEPSALAELLSATFGDGPPNG